MKKRVRKGFSLLLALVMVFSLLPVQAMAEEPEGAIAPVTEQEPAGAGAEAAESPVFLLQPESGSHAPGESYLVTWELDRTPDRLELVREEPAGDEVSFEKDEPVLVHVRELEPESTSLELTAPEEETVFRLRAFYGEEELLSEGFTVTAETAEGVEPLSPGEAGTAPRAGEPTEPAGDGVLDVPSDDPDAPEALPAEPTPDEPQDDTHYFTAQPQDGSVAPEGFYRVTWATNFYPSKVEVIQYTGYGGYNVIATITRDMTTSMSFNLYYDVVYQAVTSSGFIDHGFGIWAYYNNDKDKVFSEDFFVTPLPMEFTSQPSGGTINPGGSLTLSWTTNFMPDRIEIQYNYYQGWHTLAEIPWGEANMYNMHYTLNYDDAVTGDWRVLAYFGEGVNDYVSSSLIKITRTGHSFTQSPTGGTVVPDGSLTLRWKTDFTPTKIQVGYMTGEPGGSATFVPRATLTSDLSNNMTRTFLYNMLSLSRTWYIAAWYAADRVEYSAPIPITITPRQITQHPTGGSLEPGDSLELSWATNFTPTKVEIRYYFDWMYFTPEWRLKNTIDSDLSRQMSYTLEYEMSTTASWAVWVYYSDGQYIASNSFQITKVGRSITWPEDISIAPGESETLHWETNFDPKKVEILRRKTGFETETTYSVATLTEGLSRSMDYPLRYDEEYAPNYWGQQKWYLRIWYGDGDNQYLTSGEFLVNLANRTFTASPSGGSVILGNYLTLRWTTNFTPVKVELGYLNGENWVRRRTVTSDLARDMSWQLSYSDAVSSDSWMVRAFYGTETDEFVHSEAFTVSKRDLSFSSIPTSGYIYPWSTRVVQWTTNFEPVKVEIGYLSGSTWVTKATLTSGLQMSMKYTLDYSHAVSSSNWRIRAFYGTESNEYLQSGSFSITKRNAYVCGDNLTAAYADGVLTFSGSGAMYDFTADEVPWKGLRSSITKAVIPEGVTYIGKSAFYICYKMTEVTIPASVTAIGSGAFSSCTGLKTVRYGGLRAQWDDVTVTGSSNSYLTNADFIYLYRTGTLTGTNVGWILDGEYNLLIITGYGTSPSHVTAPWLNWAPYIETIEVEYGITGIWEEAFRDCTGVTKVYLPETVTEVDYRAFTACTGITDVYFDGPLSKWNQITIRADNDPLTDATLHTAVTPHQLTDDVAWSVDDAGLLRIYMTDEFGGDGTQNYIPNYDYNSDPPWIQEGYKEAITAVHVEAGIRRIGGYAFCGLTNMESIEIAGNVTSIGQRAFLNCSSVTSIVLPSDITSIAGYTFQNCSSLTEIRLPANTTIGEYTFAGCSSLKKVWLPDNITAIPRYFFQNCSKLVMVSMPGTVTEVATRAFYGCIALKTDAGHVYFDGTSAQFAAITLGDGNGLLPGAGHIHFTPEELPVNAANFPDANFRSYVAQSFNTDGVLVNGVAYLSEAEIAATDLEMDNEGDVTSIQGIEYLTELSYLNLQGVPGLSSADLRQNTALTEVSIGGSLTEIELDGLRYLQKLFLGGNLLTELDLDGLTNLTQLSVYGNRLTALDVSDFALTRLDVENTPLTELVLGQQPRLSTLYCYGTKLKELDLSGCPLLAETLQSGTRTEFSSYYRFNKKINNLNCWLYIGKDMICFTDHDGLPIDAAHFPDPQFRLYVSRSFDLNRSGTLSAAEIAAAREIGDEDNDYGSLQGIEYLTELEQILIDAAPSLTGVDLRANTRLYSVDFSNCGNLAELHVEGLSALQDLFVEGNRLTELDLTGVTNLYNLDVYRNPLSVLDLGEQPELCRLLCYGTQITSLDLRGCPKLLSTLAVGTRTETEDYVQYLTGYTTGWLRVDKDMELIGLGGVPVDAEHFPDPNFRGYVSTNFDKNHSGWLSEEEIAGAQVISCGAEDIVSLQGVEYFPELQELACEDNLITALDLSANTRLTRLDCSYNELTLLSLAGLSDLTDLSCEGNPLTELDVSAQKLEYLYCQETSLSALDLSGQTELRMLFCYGTSISSLDLSGCPWLQAAASEGERTETSDYVQYTFSSSAILRVDKDTQLLGLEGIPVDEEHFPDPIFRAYVESELDGNHNGWLTAAEIDAVAVITIQETAAGSPSALASLEGVRIFTQLEQLVVRGAPALSEVELSGLLQLSSLGFYDTGLTSLDVSALTLTSLACVGGPLGELTLGQQPQLQYLSVYRTELTELDVSESCPALTKLYCSECPQLSSLYINSSLEELDAFGCAFEELELYGGQLQAADLSNNTALTYLDISENQLYALNLSGDAALEILFCGDNYLAELDLSGNTALQELYYSSNLIHSLNVGHLDALRTLDCSGNPLSTLDVHANTALESLCCASVELGSLDLSRNTALMQLECYNCGLTSLDLQANTALTYLDCDENGLTQLDLSANPALSRVHAAGNALTALDLSANPALTYLDARNNASLTQLTLGAQETLSVLWASGTDLATLDIGMCPILLALYREVTPTIYAGVVTYYRNTNRLVVDAATQILQTMSGVCGDDLRWILSSDGVLTISGTGAMYNYSGSSDNLSPWYSQRDRITAVEIGEGATTVGSSAFLYCTALTDVSLPSTLKSIRSGAFSRCSALPVLVIPDSVETVYSNVFYDCAGLEHVQLPQGLKQLESETFRGCSALLEVSIPTGVTKIGMRCFYGCSSLTEVSFPAALTRIEGAAFAECTSLREIRFTGSAPTIVDSTYSHPFNNVETNVYYPMYDESWTEEIRQNYGGTLTWIPYAPPASPGDLNRDGSVNAQDLLLLRKYLVALPLEGVFDEAAADVNGDGSIDILDLVRLRKVLAA